MKILMSDLHMSSPLFKLDREIIDLYNDTNVESVYILGDIFDVWEGCLSKTLEKRKDLIDKINNSGKTVVILKGNHDPDIDRLKEIFNNVFVAKSHTIELFGKKTLLVHGDEFDGTEFWGKLLFTFQWPLERIGFNSKAWLREKIYKYKLWKTGLTNNSLVFDMEKKLVEKYGKDYNLIIAGHTHLTKLVKLDRVTYANTGNMLYNPSYLVADGNTLMIKRLK
jgi:UDP-2,3-diacylglucosamine hydrolase